jgi:hypothetical protein
MAKYIATQSVGQYLPGETIEGLSTERAKTLLVMGAIKEVEVDQEETPDKPTRRSRSAAE